ncbi:hypothetical protein VNO77_39532 [Canavalia gladiata]|uniref:Uncharacterized protein n=1 Tax=Canavalia gladiata TaxID=3824 RepID=A0AAN9PX77_CANGL
MELTNATGRAMPITTFLLARLKEKAWFVYSVTQPSARIFSFTQSFWGCPLYATNFKAMFKALLFLCTINLTMLTVGFIRGQAAYVMEPHAKGGCGFRSSIPNGYRCYPLQIELVQVRAWIRPIALPYYWRKLFDVVPHVAGLNPRAFRQFCSNRKAHQPGPDGIVDCELLCHYEMLPLEEQLEIAHQVETTQSQILSSLTDLPLGTITNGITIIKSIDVAHPALLHHALIRKRSMKERKNWFGTFNVKSTGHMHTAADTNKGLHAAYMQVMVLRQLKCVLNLNQGLSKITWDAQLSGWLATHKLPSPRFDPHAALLC